MASSRQVSATKVKLEMDEATELGWWEVFGGRPPFLAMCFLRGRT